MTGHAGSAGTGTCIACGSRKLRLGSSDQPAEVAFAAIGSLRRALAPYADGASVRLPGAMWLIMSAPASMSAGRRGWCEKQTIRASRADVWFRPGASPERTGRRHPT